MKTELTIEQKLQRDIAMQSLGLSIHNTSKAIEELSTIMSEVALCFKNYQDTVSFQYLKNRMWNGRAGNGGMRQARAQFAKAKRCTDPFIARKGLPRGRRND